MEHHGFCCGSYGVSFNLPFENDTPKFQRNCLFTEMNWIFRHTKITSFMNRYYTYYFIPHTHIISKKKEGFAGI